MDDLSDDIRGLINEGMVPVTIEEIRHVRATAGKSPEHDNPAGAGRVRRLRGWWFVPAVAVAVLLAGIALAVVPTSTHTQSGTAAAAVLDQLASTASQAAPLVPGPGEYLYTQSLEGAATVGEPSPGSPVQHGWAYYIQSVSQDWSTPNGPGRSVFYTTGAPLFLTAADRTAWQADGAKPIEVGMGFGPAPYYDVARLPTKSDQVEAYLVRQPSLGGDTQGNSPSWQFDTASEFLAAGASPSQRSALYQFMKSIPGVTDLGVSTTVGTHLPGVTLGLPGLDPGSEEEALFNLATATILEVRLVSDGTTPHPPPGAEKGEAHMYDDFVYVGIASSTNAPPKGAPALPVVWPANTYRTPLPGSAYPANG